MTPVFAAIGSAVSSATTALSGMFATGAGAVGTGLTAGGGLGLTAGGGIGLTAPAGAVLGGGAAATTAGTLFSAANLQMVGQGLSAISSIYQGQQQEEAYRLQSQQAALKGRQDALQYNRRAFQTLQANDRLRASLVARAAAGGVDPFTGSPLSLAQANDISAYEEARIDRENSKMALYGGLGQSQALQAAASTAETYGLLRGAAQAAMGGAKFMDTKLPGVLS